jgi:hypothetical protein
MDVDFAEDSDCAALGATANAASVIRERSLFIK